MPPTSRQSGFTLIEVLTVLFILALVVGFAFAKMPDKQPAAVRAATHDLAGSLMAAQTLARNSGRKVFIRTSGGGSTVPVMAWGFDDDPLAVAQGTWTVDTRTFTVVSTGIGQGDFTASAPNPDPTSVGAISGYIAAGGWALSFFDGAGAATNKVFCGTNGAFDRDFFVSVCGRKSGAVYAGCPMGVVVAGPKTGVGAFYKPVSNDAATPWQRL